MIHWSHCARWGNWRQRWRKCLLSAYSLMILIQRKNMSILLQHLNSFWWLILSVHFGFYAGISGVASEARSHSSSKWIVTESTVYCSLYALRISLCSLLKIWSGCWLYAIFQKGFLWSLHPAENILKNLFLISFGRFIT